MLDGFDQLSSFALSTLSKQCAVDKAQQHRIWKKFRNAENQTQDGWVGSANTTSALCHPPRWQISYQLHLQLSKDMGSSSSYVSNRLVKNRKLLLDDLMSDGETIIITSWQKYFCLAIFKHFFACRDCFKPGAAVNLITEPPYEQPTRHRLRKSWRLQPLELRIKLLWGVEVWKNFRAVILWLGGWVVKADV